MGNVFLTELTLVTKTKVLIFERESIKENIVGVAKGCCTFRELLESLETSCLNCLQHRRTLKPYLLTIERAKDFTIMRSLDEVHEMHKFKVVGKRQGVLQVFSEMKYQNSGQLLTTF